MDYSNNQIEEDEDLPQLVSSGQALELVGHAHKYQLLVVIVISIQFFFLGTSFLSLPLFLSFPEFYCSSSLPMVNALCQSLQQVIPSYKEIMSDYYCGLNGIDIKHALSIKETNSLLIDLDLICNRQMRGVIWTLIPVMTIIGSLLASSQITQKGRLMVMKVCSVLVCVLLSVSLLSHNVYVWLLVMCLGSISGGGYLVSGLTYLPEVMSENLRTVSPVSLPGMMCIGQACIYILVSNYLVSYQQIFMASSIGSLVSACLSHYWLVESPRWLITQKQFGNAKIALLAISCHNQRYLSSFELQAEVELNQINANIGLIMKIPAIDSQVNTHTLSQLFTFRSLSSKTKMLFCMVVVNGMALREVYQVLIRFNQDSLVSHVIINVLQMIALLVGMLFLLQCRRRQIIRLLLVINGGLLVSGLFIISKNIDPHRVSAIRSYSLLMLQGSILMLLVQTSILLVYTLELVPTAMRHYAMSIYMTGLLVGWSVQPLVIGMFGDSHKYSLCFYGGLQWVLLCFLREVRETAASALEDLVEEEKNQLNGNKHFNDY